ncbi:vitamin K epoxide reductase family protein [Spirosoma sp. KUDC1026]|uniref:vitamin K epoxide reductase family protein n=1 Tax=Spirosoma sp. KUDC1026 TaxID=2745947 RepID=UPI00159BBCF5|nr:vitamin K epoxide reductase family protein [Spirosoma sp. KUDC1026]QKZ11318.1 vitamin K epoxide reductase family protein [Spirosoma sp. KUDC1026]
MADTHHSAHLSNHPPGWTYNPSSWPERVPLVVIAVVGLLISLYLGLYQLRIIPDVWDPIFGSASSKKILNSPLSKVLPIPDALLGAIGYLIDAISGVVGKIKRWKTMPWIVVLFGVAVGPLGVTSLFLVIAQPVLFDAWCSLCMASAVISIIMIGPAMDEVLASLQYLQRVKRSGMSVWKAFWGDKEISAKLA